MVLVSVDVPSHRYPGASQLSYHFIRVSRELLWSQRCLAPAKAQAAMACLARTISLFDDLSDMGLPPRGKLTALLGQD
jgi:hypothetical protein